MKTCGAVLGRILTLALATALAGGCDQVGDPTPGDLFEYTGFDEQDRRVVEGTLLFDRVDAVDVAGRWRLSSSRPETEVGPQIGEGEFRGSINREEEGAMLFLNLNPRHADYNVFLSGTLDGGRLEGRWSFSTLLGERRSGRFEARRR